MISQEELTNILERRNQLAKFLDIKTNYRHKNFTLSSGITNLTDETAWTGPHQYPNRTFVTDLSWKY